MDAGCSTSPATFCGVTTHTLVHSRPRTLQVWWMDAGCGILISVYILYSWYQICQEQVWGAFIL